MKKISEKIISLIGEKVTKMSHEKDVFIVGISGLDASGKSTIAKLLCDDLEKNGKKTITISGDSFQFPREYKENYVEDTWALQHIKRTINFELLERSLLIPIKQQRKDKVRLDMINYDSGEKIYGEVLINYPLIIILESIYLFQKPIVDYIDYKIFLEVTKETALLRATNRARDIMLYGSKEGVTKKYEMKNFAGYELFDKQTNPRQYADLIIETNDPQNLSIISGSLQDF